MMPVSMQWIIAEHAILVDFTGIVTLDELRSLEVKSHELLDSNDQAIHFFLDATHMTSFPLNVIKLQQIVGQMIHHAMASWIVINANKVSFYTALLLGRLFGVPVISAESIDEAITVVRRLDTSLDSLPAFEIKRTNS